MSEVYYVYILYSASKDKYYVGYTGQLKDRFDRHQSGRSKSTKSGRPWVIAYLQVYNNSTDVYQQEMAIKKKKSRKYIQQLVDNFKANPYPLTD